MEWFEAHAWKDMDGDYWRSEEEYKAVAIGPRFSGATTYVSRDEILNGGIEESEPNDLDYNFTDTFGEKYFKLYGWAIVETPESHPQYFI